MQTLEELNSYDGIGVVKPNGAINCRIDAKKGTYEVTDSYIVSLRMRDQFWRLYMTMGLTELTSIGGITAEVFDVLYIDNKAISLIPGEYAAYYITIDYDKYDGIPSGLFHYTEQRTYIIVYFSTGDTASYLVDSKQVAYSWR